eukprot:749450-Hanusia_phi.AAC.3
MSVHRALVLHAAYKAAVSRPNGTDECRKALYSIQSTMFATKQDEQSVERSLENIERQELASECGGIGVGPHHELEGGAVVRRDGDLGGVMTDSETSAVRSSGACISVAR